MKKNTKKSAPKPFNKYKNKYKDQPKEIQKKEESIKKPFKNNEKQSFHDNKKTGGKPSFTPKKSEFFIFDKNKHTFTVKEKREKPGNNERTDYIRLEIKKENLTTLQAIDIIANKLDIPVKEVGFGGLKDKDATTRQRISFSKKFFNGDIKKLPSLKIKNISITQSFYSENPIKISSHEKNTFTIKLQKPKELNQEDFKKNLNSAFEEIKKKGMRNFFGNQKFGHTGGNRKIGQELLKSPSMKLEGDVNSAIEKKFKVQAFSSFLFNTYLKKRIQKGLGDEKILGDVIQKNNEGKDEVTGPVYGFDLKTPTKSDKPESAYQLEKETLQDFDLTEKDLQLRKKFGIYGIRRAIKTQPENMQISFPGEQCIIQFTLGQGSYATVFIDQIERDMSRQNNRKNGIFVKKDVNKFKNNKPISKFKK